MGVLGVRGRESAMKRRRAKGMKGGRGGRRGEEKGTDGRRESASARACETDRQTDGETDRKRVIVVPERIDDETDCDEAVMRSEPTRGLRPVT